MNSKPSSRTSIVSRKWTLGLAMLSLGAGLLVVAQSATSGQKTAPPAPRVLTVQTIRAERVTSFTTPREYTGTIFARRISELSFERSGRADEIHVEEGDAVAPGDRLAGLDTERIRTRRREVVARRAQAAALLDEMVAGPRAEDIAAAEANVNGLTAEVELLKLQTDRSRRLLRQSATAQAEFDRYSFGLKSRQARLEESRQQLAELVNGTRPEQIAGQRALVAQLEASIEEIDVELRKSTLRAPFAGTISHRHVDEGTVVEEGQPVLTLVETSRLEARVGLPPETARSLPPGSTRRVRLDGRTFDVRLGGRRPEVNARTRTRTAIFELEPSASQFVVHGQVVRVQLDERIAADGFWLPITALTKGERGLWSCLVAADADSANGTLQVERHDVEVLYTRSDRVLVRGTLADGDRVIATGTHRVSVGQWVASGE